jgi:hypothetical protein
VINDSVQIYRSNPRTIEKILSQFPGSSQKIASDGYNTTITLALPQTLQSEVRAEAEVIEEKYIKEVAALIEQEHEQMRRLAAHGLLTAPEVATVQKFIASEMRDRKPTERFSSILGITK